MGFRNVHYALDHSPYKGTPRMIHVVLADVCSDETGIGYPSQAFIARRANCTIESVRTSVKQMIADGYIEMVQASGAGGHTAHTYRFVLPKGFGDLPKSVGGSPQKRRALPPNPSPTNHQRTTIEPETPTKSCRKCGSSYKRSHTCFL
jgi:hypothetical protein